MSDESSTRDQILDAAEALFARQGFAATTIKQIGAEAGANPALLYYYFGDKAGLYRELLKRVFAWIAVEGGSRLEQAGPADAVRGVLALQTETMTARPALPRLIAREMVDHGAAHAGEELVRLSATVFARLCELIQEGQRAGLFRRDLDPRFAAVSTLSLVPWFHVAGPAVGVLLKGEAGAVPDDETKRAYGRHAAEFALAALAARPGQADAPVDGGDR